MESFFNSSFRKMMAILCALVTLLLSLASASPFALRAASSHSDSDPDRTYVEVLYPRNETYRLDAPLPIVLAVSNLPPTESLGNFSLHWAVATYGNDDEPGDLLGVRGSMYPRNQTADKSQPVVMADFVDLLYEFNHVSHYVPDRLELLLGLRYERGKDADACLGEDQGLPYEMVVSVGFRVALADDQGRYGDADAVPIDLRTATGCPGAGAGVRVTTTTGSVRRQTTTATTPGETTCTRALVTPTSTQRSDCPFTVDASMASSISSSLSVLMMPPPTTTLPTYSSSNRAAAAMPIQTGGMAAAGIVGAMMLL